MKTAHGGRIGRSVTDASGQDTVTGGAMHFRGLDGLRGWASLAVVFYHLEPLRPELAALSSSLPGFLVVEVIGRGRLGVAVFFVLSGFVIAYSIRSSLTGVEGQRIDSLLPVGEQRRFAPATFMARRAARLTPPYYAAVLVALVFALGAAVEGDEPFAPGHAPFSVGRLLAHLSYGQEILGYVNFNDVFWTLGLEMQFYFVLAVLVVVVHEAPDRLLGVRLAPVVFTAATVVAVFWPLTVEVGAPRPVWFPPLVYSFLLGSIVVLRALRIVPVAVPLGLIAAVFVVALVHPYNREFAVTSAATALALWLAVETEALDRILVGPVSQFLGRISYSLYLVHTPVIGAALVVTALLTPRTPGWQFVGVVAALAASIVAGTILYWLVERPSVRLSRRLGRRSAAPPLRRPA